MSVAEAQHIWTLLGSSTLCTAKSRLHGQSVLHQRHRSSDRHVFVLQSAPTYLANAQAPWQIASGVIYPEDITDDSPYLFSEIPGRLTGSYSGYNEDPLFVLVRILPQYCVTHLLANLHCFSPFWLSCRMSYSWQELLACLALPLKKDGDPLMP